MGAMPHIPVMLPEVLEHLAPIKGGLFVDGTFGNGGYSAGIIEADGEVIAIDRDPSAIAAGAGLVKRAGGALRLIEGRFGDFENHLSELGVAEVDGVVFDIGVSSMQVDQAMRGFSFRADGPLDMRMAQAGKSAADVVNTYKKADLRRIISILGEEKKAGYVAHAIVMAREDGPISTTKQLAAIVEDAVGRRRDDTIHPATRTFQALRIFVNDELHELAYALGAAERLLRPGGRLVVVTFHSLEDRIVKRFMKSRANAVGGGSRHQPEIERAPATFEERTRRPIVAGEAETAHNPRARSAKLRAAMRLPSPARPLDLSEIGVPALSIQDEG